MFAAHSHVIVHLHARTCARYVYKSFAVVTPCVRVYVVISAPLTLRIDSDCKPPPSPHLHASGLGFSQCSGQFVTLYPSPAWSTFMWQWLQHGLIYRFLLLHLMDMWAIGEQSRIIINWQQQTGHPPTHHSNPTQFLCMGDWLQRWCLLYLSGWFKCERLIAKFACARACLVQSCWLFVSTNPPT